MTALLDFLRDLRAGWHMYRLRRNMRANARLARRTGQLQAEMATIAEASAPQQTEVEPEAEPEVAVIVHYGDPYTPTRRAGN